MGVLGDKYNDKDTNMEKDKNNNNNNDKPKNKSWKSKIVDAMHTIREVTSQILDEVNDGEIVEDLFDSDSNDLHVILKKEKEILSTPSTTTATTTIDDISSKPPIISCDELWEKQREKWLTPNASPKMIKKRIQKGKLVNLDNYHDDIYVDVYRNLVIRGRTLKRGLNMEDGFKVIFAGWQHDKMFERVANGGIP